MNCRLSVMGVLFSAVLAGTGLAAPVIDPIANVTIPAGKSLILPITATSASGRALTYTITSSTNAIAVVMHTNNPFWQLTVAQAAATNAPGAYNTPYRGGLVSVTNVGTMTFMLFPEYASHTINVFQGLTESGFYNSNTIFHRVISGFMIQGGDPETNGAGGLVFQYNDEFNPQAIFSGNGQLALANSGKNTDGSQFFVTIAPYRSGDFTYTIFGQLVRGFPILTNLNSTAVDTSSRPLADEIIQTAAYVTNTADTVLTLTATNVSGAAGTITVIADDGAGGRATNTFKAATATDTNSNNNAFINTQILATNLVAPVNMTLTNLFSATELDGETLYWYLFLAEGTPANSISNGPFYPSNSILRNLTYNLTNANGLIQFLLEPYSNYSGTVSVYFDVSSVNTNIYDLANWSLYQHYGYTMPPFDEQLYTFVFGDTPILGQSNTVTALPAMPFTNLVLATFTNGVAGSIYTNFTASINWGDNSTNVGTLTANAAGRKAVLGSHTYSYPGSYPVYVAVQSGIGASTTILSIVNVTNPPTPVTNSLTVQASGQGTVAYSNTPLAVGDSYSVGATAANLWFLLNWTDNNGFVLGTGTNLTFTMSPGLSLNANFALIANPTVTIASPTNSQVVTNLYSSLATITGTASNNATVASVWCQVNSGGWWQAVGTTNWSFSFTPTYSASNFVQAYSVNNYGYVSTTNTMLVKYLAGGVLTLTTNGLGSIAPNLNGDLLPFGTNYTLTATPASGFSFVNWTGSFSTNKATLSFTMTNSPSLTATFADATAPTIAITNLASGQQVTTNVFGALGTASDNNWLVANVFYSLNGAAWTNATTTNTWTNWTAVLTLMAGTNTIAAYAVDPNGKPSLTNAFSFQYLVTNQLVIRSVGLGTILPNYSNSWLQIGHNYSMVATPATGFAFTNWTISTNWLGGAVTNNATVQFMMASNLTLQVTFADVTKPAVNITNLVAGQRVTNTAFTLMGTASDNVQVSNVQVQLNGVWTNATTANVWTNWSAVLNLNPGTNTVAAFAADTSGNPSITNQLTFDSVVTNLLGVRAVGLGTIAPNDSNAWLEVGRNYTIAATPATGFVVTNWIISTNWLGGAVTNNATVQFMMASNLTVQVTFAETNKPTLTITWPTSGQHMTNALPTVIGTVSDDWGVAGVWYQLNGGAWTAPFTTNVWTNWSATVQLGAGSNMVSAYALNLGGNYSATNSVSVLSSNAFLLKLGFLTATPSATNGLNFGLLVSTGLTGHIQFSTNLLSWATLTNFSGSNSPLHLLDPAATNSSARYYRAVIP